jgi:hypothetical protein
VGERNRIRPSHRLSNLSRQRLPAASQRVNYLDAARVDPLYEQRVPTDVK